MRRAAAVHCWPDLAVEVRSGSRLAKLPGTGRSW